MEFCILCIVAWLALLNRWMLQGIAKKLAICLLLCGSAFAQEIPNAESMALQPDTRAWFRNPDGSCVQCSIGMAGVWCNDPNAASLLWDTHYGPAVRGGSWPSRVSQYCNERGIVCYNITGKTTEDTLPWLEWAAKTGRFAAIGADTAHFQTLYGYSKERERWYVCNNNSTHVINEYTPAQFKAMHAASGPWVVILEKPSSPPPQIRPWWK